MIRNRSNRRWISVGLSVVVILVVGFCGDLSFAQPIHRISGTVTSKVYGEALLDCKLLVRVWDYGGGYSQGYVYTDINGYYEFWVGEQDRIQVNPYDSTYIIPSIPEAIARLSVESQINDADFVVTTGVKIRFDTVSSTTNWDGTLVSSGGVDIAILENSFPIVFRPVELGLPNTGYVFLSKPFHEFSPQNQGYYIYYDCRTTAIQRNPQYDAQSISPNPVVSSVYSWNDPGGTGWDKFPATPDDRMPNNPNVYVSVDFNISGTWPKEDIRLNNVTAKYDLTHANSHTAVFEYEIDDCSRGQYQVEVMYRKGYNNWWAPLAEYKMSGTSNGDLTGDDLIGFFDVVALAQTQGLCEGDTGYLPCADYNPDGCIDILDVTVFTEIYYAIPNKTSSGVAKQGDVWLLDNDTNIRDCILRTDSDWDAAVIQFRVPATDQAEIVWEPAAAYENRSLLAKNDMDGDSVYSLFVLASGESETTVLGSMSAESSADLDDVVFTSAETGSTLNSSNKSYASVPNRTYLGDASPNPFNPMTKISFELSSRSVVSLSVYDLAGRLVCTLIDCETVEPGRRDVTWNGTDNRGNPVAAGVYLYNLDTGRFAETKRITLLK